MSKALEMAVAKFAVAFVAVAMMVSLVAPVAQAQTTEELQTMINDLLAQVAALSAQTGQGGQSVASGVCPYTWTRSLNSGATGADVMKLQQFLNADVETRVSVSGAGSVGAETEYYGPATGAAVAKFQTKYRSDILTPLGLVNATTYFGPSTMAKANMLCATAPVVADDSSDDSDDSDDSSDDSLNGGESSLEDLNGSDGDDTDLEEGQENAPVAEFEFDVEDGDIKINRMDIAFDEIGGGSGIETEPWDTFETVSLWVDGDMIAEMDVDSESDWNDDEPTDGVDRLRFTGLDQIFREGDTANITVGVTVQGNVDGITSSVEAEWEIFIPVDGIRGIDGAGIDQYIGEQDNNTPYAESATFTIEEEGGQDELNIQTSSDDPDATTLAVEDDTNSDWLTILIFDLDTDDSVNDILVDTAVVSVIVSGEAYNDVVNDAQLVIDGEVFDDFTVSSGTTATATLTFDIDKDLEINAGDEVAAELQIEFRKADGVLYSEGQTVQGTTTSTGWAAEGADDLVGTQLTGSAVGEIHTLRVEGVILEPGTTDADTQGDTDATGIFEINFDVTAFEGDFYIAEHATTTGVSTLGGVDFSVEGPAAVTSASGVLASTADEDIVGVFTVREGQTETFTLTVTVDASTTGQHRVLLNDVWFSATNDGKTSIQTDTASPAQDYRTAYVNVNAI